MYTNIKTFEDACAAIGCSIEIPSLQGGYDKHGQSLLAYYKLTIIAEALNEGWIPDWDDYSQYKWVPYFRNKSGFGLAFDDYDSWSTSTDVGSRLCFKSSEIAVYVATQFADLYNDFLTIK